MDFLMFATLAIVIGLATGRVVAEWVERPVRRQHGARRARRSISNRPARCAPQPASTR